MKQKISSLPAPQSKWAWLLAARPKTLTAAIVPILAGTLLAFARGIPIAWWIPLVCLFSALCIQIGTNLINDALDYKKGADTSSRIGPVRMTQSGLLTERSVYAGGLAFFALAFLGGIPLMFQGGIPLFIILLLSVGAGYIYTGGPMPLAYAGLGDLFVFIFFGIVATSAVDYLQEGIWHLEALLAGVQIGMLATVLIAINNFRDREGDAKANKLTLAVRFGKKFSRIEITMLLLLPFALNLLWLFYGFNAAALLPFLVFPLAVKLAVEVWSHDPSPIFNKFLGFAALIHFLFGILLSIGFCIIEPFPL